MTSKIPKLKKPRQQDCEIWERDKWTCQYCGYRTTDFRTWWLGHFNIDHVIPKKHGGSDDMDNRVVACGQCNSYKGDFYDEEMKNTDLGGKIEIVKTHLKKKVEEQHLEWYNLYVKDHLNVQETQSFLIDIDEKK